MRLDEITGLWIPPAVADGAPLVALARSKGLNCKDTGMARSMCTCCQGYKGTSPVVKMLVLAYFFALNIETRHRPCKNKLQAKTFIKHLASGRRQFFGLIYIFLKKVGFF